MQYLITAFDDTDEHAEQRRLDARPSHLAEANKLKETGNIIAGGAILNDEGKMIGSTLYVDFDNRDDLDEWLKNDPYVTGDVWKDVHIIPIKLAIAP